MHLTTLLRDAKGVAVTGVPMTLVIERPDGVEYRRTVVQDQGVGGRALSFPMISSAPTGTYRVRAYTDPKGPAVGSDQLPGRRLRAGSHGVRSRLADRQAVARTTPAEVTVDGRFLYGAPASNLDLEGEMKIKAGGRAGPGFAGYQFGVNDDEDELSTEQTTLEDLPADRRQRQGEVHRRARQAAEHLASARGADHGAPGRVRRPRGRAQPHAADRADRDHDRRQAAVRRQVARRGRERRLRRDRGRARRQAARRAAGCATNCSRSSGATSIIAATAAGSTSRSRSTRRMADGRIDVAADQPGRIALPVTWGRYRLDVASDDRSIPPTSVTFDAGFYSDASADTPDLLEIALDKTEYAAGDTMNGRRDGAHRRQGHASTWSATGCSPTTTADVQAGAAKIPLTVGRDWGSGAYVVATLRRPLDEAASRMPGRAIGVQWFSVDKQARTLALEMPLPSLMRPNGTLARAGAGSTALPPARRRRIVVAAVDVGILNLTNYKPPSPDDYYLGQRRLTAEVRDLYGQLLDGMQGTRGAIRTGGDGSPAALGGDAADPAAARALFGHRQRAARRHRRGAVRHSGLRRHRAGDGGRLDQGQGRPRLRRRDRARSGGAHRDLAALPADRRPRHHAARSRQCRRSGRRLRDRVQTDGPLAVGQARRRSIRLAGKQRSGVSLPISATAVGIGNVAIRISGPNGFEMQRSYTLAAKPATQVLDAPHRAADRARARASRSRATCSPIWCRAPAACSSRSVPRPRSTSRRC